MTIQCEESSHQTTQKQTSVAPAACETEWTDLLHITGDNTQLFCLTKSQLIELKAEEALVSSPISELQNAYSQTNESILGAKEKTWESLKQQQLIPPLRTSSSTTPLKQYEAQWALAQKRYQRQVRRCNRIKNDIHVIRNELKHGLLIGPSRRFYSRYLASLEQTQADLDLNLGNLKTVADQKRQRLENEQLTVKKLQAAVESEVDYRVACQKVPSASVDTIKQLRAKAVLLSESANLSQYVSEDKLKHITDIEVRLVKCESRIDSNAQQMRELRVLRFLHWSVGKKELFKNSSASLEKYDSNQQTNYQLKRSLILEKDKFYTTLPSPDVVDTVIHIPAIRRLSQLVEIKRTGSPSFTYIRREALAQFKKNWQKLSMSQVAGALKNTPKGINGAAKDAAKELSKNINIKLVFAEWKSTEDNFFNQLNKELFNVSLNGDVPPENRQIDASAEAQLMRFSAGAQFASDYNPREGTIHVGAEAKGSYNLLQAQVAAKVQLPSAAGGALILSYQGDTGELKQLHCGYFRSHFSLTLQGSVGACALLSSHIRIDTKPSELSVGGEMKGNVFAGGMLRNEAEVAIEWAKPVASQRKQSKRSIQPSLENFKELVKVVPSISLAAGIGLGFDYSVGYDEGKFVLQLSAQLVCGPGGAGGVAVELNAAQVMEVIEFIRFSLEQSDFRFLEWVSENAFEMVSIFTGLDMVFEKTVEQLLEMSYADISNLWKRISENQVDVKLMCRRILASSNIETSTPLAKSKILHSITKRYLFNENSLVWDDDELQASACMKLLDSIPSEREFIEILRLMGAYNGGGKGRADVLVGNFKRLFNHLLFKSTQKHRAFEWLNKLALINSPSLE